MSLRLSCLPNRPSLTSTHPSAAGSCNELLAEPARKERKRKHRKKVIVKNILTGLNLLLPLPISISLSLSLSLSLSQQLLLWSLPLSHLVRGQIPNESMRWWNEQPYSLYPSRENKKIEQKIKKWYHYKKTVSENFRNNFLMRKGCEETLHATSPSTTGGHGWVTFVILTWKVWTKRFDTQCYHHHHFLQKEGFANQVQESSTETGRGRARELKNNGAFFPENSSARSVRQAANRTKLLAWFCDLPH